MENQTLRVRLAALRQKSLKAFGLYRRIGRGPNSERARLNDLQLNEWKELSADLGKRLTAVVEESNFKNLNAKAFSLRDHFLNLWRTNQTALHARRTDLMRAAEQSDFIKATILSQELIALRAREQACQAAYSELHNILADKADRRADKERAEQNAAVESKIEAEPSMAQVIPLRRAK